MASASDQPESVNPYAPSAVTDPRENFLSAGVGVWRHGDQIVMHCDAQLPPICLITGQAAAGWFIKTLHWSPRPFMLWPRVLHLRVPLGPRHYFRVTRLRWVLLGLGIALLGAIICLSPYLDEMPVIPAVVVALGGGVGAVILLVIGIHLGELVHVVRSDGNYLWLSGAGPAFLAKLPHWPHGA